jgi:hypothetical protein
MSCSRSRASSGGNLTLTTREEMGGVDPKREFQFLARSTIERQQRWRFASFGGSVRNDIGPPPPTSRKAGVGCFRDPHLPASGAWGKTQLI